MPRLLSALTACLVLAAAAGASSPLQLPIGDPARRDRQAPLLLDAITDTANGQVISPPELARRLRNTGILFIGENHTSIDFHEVELGTIRALHESGREVIIGLEMLPYTEQPALDAWTRGRLTESQFLEESGWYENWGHHWNYYREILGYARENRLRLYAINSPRKVVRRIRAGGLTVLTPEEASHFPPNLAPDSAEHRRLYRASFAVGDELHLKEDALEGLYRAQTAWDATLGWNAFKARQESGSGTILVALIGTGHVAYGLGSERQIDPYYEGGIASLLPVPVVDTDSRAVSQVQASYASFVWGIPREGEPLYPVLGVSVMGSMGKDPTQVIQVSPDSATAQAGLRAGDVLTSFNGSPLDGESALRRLTAGLRWGDVVRLGVRRDGEALEFAVPVRRAQPARETGRVEAPGPGD